MSKKDQFVPEAWHGGTKRTETAELSDDLNVIKDKNCLSTYKSDPRLVPVTRKDVDRSRDLRNCFSYSK